MTPAQEQAANAARKACIAWLRSTTDKRESSAAAMESYESYRRASSYAPTVESKNAYLAAWRTTWETA